ncbi:thiopurine S-methyltransferase [Alkalimarinus coralli]|uniref:thiopurine S-methyltransferase n=1 Tax=Alkalimarinus coralli TaxID=2935863 RepID=UPI00202B19D0|nr:thiopurine S-methyltransferase [Alkalimarinus coralli]
MEASFWHQRWELGEIAFHEGQANALLVQYFAKLNLEKGSKVFVPLCGKTRDIAWLLTQGYQVVGAELSELAIKELFSDLEIEPEISEVGDLIHYHGEGIDIYVGDIFSVTAAQLGQVDAIYDRAALVALPEHMRQQYTSHLITITGTAPQLMICYEYDQLVMPGPPFSICDEEVKQHYDGSYRLLLLESSQVSGGLKGKAAAVERVWLLQK